MLNLIIFCEQLFGNLNLHLPALTIALMFILLSLLNACNTVTGTVEGTARGIINDVKTIHHYSTCVFTDTQCGDIDLIK